MRQLRDIEEKKTELTAQLNEAIDAKEEAEEKAQEE